MAEKIATREAFGKAIAALSAEHPELIVLDADLAGATKSGEFKKACPEHFLDMGIAEADMVGVAAGLAACGKKPFCCSFAMFTAGRAYEQVRNSVAYPRPVSYTHLDVYKRQGLRRHRLHRQALPPSGRNRHAVLHYAGLPDCG